jgi:hypothetical protein
MRNLRLLVIAVGCLIAGPVLVFRFFSALPSLEKLDKVSGVVQFDTETRSTRSTSTQYPVFIVGGDRYKYLDWFPKADSITSFVRAGDQVAIWTDKGANEWVWQIEQDGKLVMPYSDVRNAVASNKRFDWIIGGGVFFLGLIASGMLYRQHVRAA